MRLFIITKLYNKWEDLHTNQQQLCQKYISRATHQSTSWKALNMTTFWTWIQTQSHGSSESSHHQFFLSTSARLQLSQGFWTLILICRTSTTTISHQTVKAASNLIHTNTLNLDTTKISNLTRTVTLLAALLHAHQTHSATFLLRLIKCTPLCCMIDKIWTR